MEYDAGIKEPYNMKNISDRREEDGAVFRTKPIKGERGKAIPFNGEVQASEIPTRASQ
jgi:hypothetical protein